MRRIAVFHGNLELWLALLAAIVVTAAYVVVTQAAGVMPPAANLFGHGIGILGFVLMLMTEILYTLRKRAKSARWGKVSSWLKFHIFTGLVGSYLVLLHPAMRFNGIAAVLSLLTGIVVLSGATGRYLYTRAPRGEADEVIRAVAPAPVVAARGPAAAQEMSPAAGPGRPVTPLVATVPRPRKGLAMWRAIHVPLTFVLFAVAVVHIVGAVYYATLLH